MGSTRKRMAGVAAVALSAGLFAQPALAQQGGGHSQREGVANSKAGQQTMPMNNQAGGGRSVATARIAAVEADAAAPSAGRPAPSPAAPGGGGGSGSSSVPVPAPAVTAPPAAAPVGAAATPGLSQDAPEIAPSLGVVGGRGGSSSPSPAATPEPSTLLLMGTGLVGLYRLRKRQ